MRSLVALIIGFTFPVFSFRDRSSQKGGNAEAAYAENYAKQSPRAWPRSTPKTVPWS